MANSMIFRIDLHNHSCLSPCASLDNAPEEIARCAVRAGIDIVALTDHNTALNAPAFAIACARHGLVPLFGLELNPREEAHLLVLFADPLKALAFSDWVSGYIPDLGVEPGSMGDQVVVDPEERILATPGCWYGAALEEGWDVLVRAAAEAGALVIPAHVDRPQMSVYSQLGFLPRGPYDAVEAVWIGSAGAAAGIPGTQMDAEVLTCGLCVLAGSDAHVPLHVGRRSSQVSLDSDAPIAGLKSALAEMAGSWEQIKDEDKGMESWELPSTAFRSGEIPGMEPLLEFLKEGYPFALAEALFRSLRKALHEHRAGRLV